MKTPKQIELLICNDYEGGGTLLFLAAKYNLSHETIRRMLKKNNIKIRKCGGFKPKEYIDLNNYKSTKYIGVYELKTKDEFYYCIYNRYGNKYYIFFKSSNINECAQKYNEKIIKSGRRGFKGALNIITNN